MFSSKNSDESVLRLSNAAFCLDCEIISDSRTDECAFCGGRSLVSLARMLGGSLAAHRVQQLETGDSGLFDVTITVELRQMYATDLSTTVERLTSAIGTKLARDRATFHLSVQPTEDKFDLQGSLHFPERNAA